MVGRQHAAGLPSDAAGILHGRSLPEHLRCGQNSAERAGPVLQEPAALPVSGKCRDLLRQQYRDTQKGAGGGRSLYGGDHYGGLRDRPQDPESGIPLPRDRQDSGGGGDARQFPRADPPEGAVGQRDDPDAETVRPVRQRFYLGTADQSPGLADLLVLSFRAALPVHRADAVSAVQAPHRSRGLFRHAGALGAYTDPVPGRHDPDLRPE